MSEVFVFRLSMKLIFTYTTLCSGVQLVFHKDSSCELVLFDLPLSPEKLGPENEIPPELSSGCVKRTTDVVSRKTEFTCKTKSGTKFATLKYFAIHSDMEQDEATICRKLMMRKIFIAALWLGNPQQVSLESMGSYTKTVEVGKLDDVPEERRSNPNTVAADSEENNHSGGRVDKKHLDLALAMAELREKADLGVIHLHNSLSDAFEDEVEGSRVFVLGPNGEIDTYLNDNHGTDQVTQYQGVSETESDVGDLINFLGDQVEQINHMKVEKRVAGDTVFISCELPGSILKVHRFRPVEDMEDIYVPTNECLGMLNNNAQRLIETHRESFWRNWIPTWRN